jgi:nucleoid-associated protein YgaU
MLIILAAVVLLTFAGGFLTGHSVSSSQSHPKPVATAPAHPHPNPTPTPPAPHPAPHKPHHVTYTVHPGDTLWGIAGHIYHNPVQWQHLYHVNSKVIGLNPNLIHVGTVLQLE